jgi:hypothetical protein
MFSKKKNNNNIKCLKTANKSEGNFGTTCNTHKTLTIIGSTLNILFKITTRLYINHSGLNAQTTNCYVKNMIVSRFTGW